MVNQVIIMLGENVDKILCLKSIGSGGDPQVIPPLESDGLVAVSAINGKKLFTIDSVNVVLAPSRERLYSVQPNEIAVYDAGTGQQVKNISIEPREYAEIIDSKIVKRSISSDETLFYEVLRTPIHGFVFQSTDLNTGRVLNPVMLKNDCSMMSVHNVIDAVYFRCGRAIKAINVYNQTFRSLNLPFHASLALSPDQQTLYALFDGKLSAYDNATQRPIKSLNLLKNHSEGHHKLLVSRDGSKLVIISSVYEKLNRDEMTVYKSVGKAVFEVLDLTDNRHINCFTYEDRLDHFTAFELTHDGTILYATILQRQENSIDTTLLKIDILTGKVLSRRTYFDSVITEIFLI